MNKQKHTLAPFRSTELSDRFRVVAEYLPDAKNSSLLLTFKISGPMSQLCLPSREAVSGWKEGIWLNSCFSCFVLNQETGQYAEFIFSPSGDWCALSFDAYRRRADTQQTAWKPEIFTFIQAASDKAHMTVKFTLLPQQREKKIFCSGLAAILHLRHHAEPLYWALRHAGEKPDFHHPDSMVLTFR